MLNGHGDDLHLIEVEIKHNFSSNVYYKGCPKTLLDEVSRCVNQIQSYPSPTANELNELAAKKFQLKSNQFLFTNGATEAFYLIAQLFSNKKAAIVAPTFAEYEDACKIFHLDYELINVAELQNTNANLVFICNPNNPNGNVLFKAELEYLFQEKPNTIFVIDEAYIEFTTSIESIVSLTSKYNNLIIVRSLTKTFTIPGLRLGYVISDASLIAKLLTLKMPWSVNLLAIKAGEYIFKNYDKLQFNVSELLEETAVFKKQLSKLNGIRVCESDTSYFLIELFDKPANELKHYLIKEHQILVRDATNFNKLEGEYVRLSTQSKDANNSLIQILKAWI
ncbi:aminotransferase class I/II-fold pyridoxal phosphate-dependent enzyme [Formosa sediminum]|uniref:Aminotransferase class I/II-fold pyridoxal phosphate-dependent enzyme n=1 Tax=Formosa sediminum TaxID=2594004 RepID=A0A516GSB8_9FLAO|nr:aminotransferase class I/II-fold pyridoxal phosphate-dependent enzyme [Formosa sediminum]QDO94406.1 aminotransferase class I/II-fold pyridoxal phosphate-dependent enzyme [Formosa sediminum]